jgi:hypothetical protein
MQIDAALVKEQGQSFAVVVVDRNMAFKTDQAKREAQASFAHLFPGVPIVLMWQDSQGTPTYWGRPDIAKFLASINLQQVPWKRYTVN